MTQAAATRSGPAGAAAAVANGGVAAVEIAAIRVYQWTLRPFIGANCRFWPSCSEYAVTALRHHGALRGTAMATKRILRCNPWHEGGVDPVPPPTTSVIFQAADRSVDRLDADVDTDRRPIQKVE